MKETIKTLLGEVYNRDGRFEDLEDQVVSPQACASLVRRLAVGYEFSGMGPGYIELEQRHGGDLRKLDTLTGELSEDCVYRDILEILEQHKGHRLDDTLEAKDVARAIADYMEDILP